MVSLVTWLGNGSASLTSTEGDDNWDILNGRVQAITATPRAVDENDEGKTLELGAGSSIVNLPSLTTLMAAVDSEITSFKITIKNIDTTAKTVNAYNAGDGTQAFDDGTYAITLAQGEFITIQSDSTELIWNVIVRGNYLSSANTWTGANTFNGITTFNALTTLNQGADVVSAAALPVLTDGNYFDVTVGAVTVITSINTVGVGSVIKLHFDGAVTLTHHATDLILPGGADIITAVGDEAEFFEYATGDWRCTNYQKATASAAEGDIYYRDSDGDFQRLAIGTAGQALLTNSGATAPEWASPVETYTSTAYTTYSAGTTLTASAHSLSGAPDNMWAMAQCTHASGDQGYAQNDWVRLPDTCFPDGFASYTSGVGVYADATNIGGITGSFSGMSVPHKTTGVMAAATAGRWSIYIKAVKYK